MATKPKATIEDLYRVPDNGKKVFRASAPDQPSIHRRGEIAEAEPALPGWRMPVDELFA